MYTGTTFIILLRLPHVFQFSTPITINHQAIGKICTRACKICNENGSHRLSCLAGSLLGLSGDLNGDYLIAPQCLARENFQILPFGPIANASTCVLVSIILLEIRRMN